MLIISNTSFVLYNKSMKKILIFMIVVLFSIISLPVYAVDVNNFYFSDFTGDYYLSKDAEGVSHLKVKESVTAVFPDYNQNKGICRQIPYANQNGKNVTLPNLTRSNLTLTRNGKPENIYSIDKESGFYNVCTGTEEYVLGEQTYVFEYEFSKVVTEFEEKGRVFQELYWDTNGNGATQRFDKVTARLHFENPEVWTGDSWCYVGAYKASGQDRCKTTKLEDGVEFVAEKLTRYENLTFDVELKAGSFVVPLPPDNYAYVIILVILGVICGLWLTRAIWKYVSNREKANYYKAFFVKPEYQPNKDYSLPEMTEIFLGKKKDMKVGMLLEMVVKHKIELKKGEKKKWSIIVKDLDDVTEEYVDLLSILNGGDNPEVGDEIEVKTRTATSKLVALRNSMNSAVVKDLKRDELVEKKYSFGSSSGRGVANAIVSTIVAVPVLSMIGIMILSTFEDALGIGDSSAGNLIFEEYFFQTAFVMILVTVLTVSLLNEATRKYAGHTLKGLEMSRYMDGLKLYIEMAEAERMKMLQSVEGADTSAEGIVKLYEKLLPYAAVFGAEESWMNEMKKYCEVEEIEEPDYLMTGLAVSEITRGLNRVSSVASASTVMSSSGGGSSSGFSGGGGGGFSGGGGGGGGFSGR